MKAVIPHLKRREGEMVAFDQLNLVTFIYTICKLAVERMKVLLQITNKEA